MAGNPLDPAEYARLTGFEGKWRDTWWRRDFLELCARRWRVGPSPSVLDVGCGAGHWGRTLCAALSGEPVLAGIDIEPEFLARAEAAALSRGLSNVEYRPGSADAIPYPDARFDVVTCQTLLIHVPSAQDALAEMRRVLKPGGLLVAAEPDNVSGYLSYLMAEPRAPWGVIHRQVDFYHTCMQGKAALGMGDSSVGARLPLLLGQAGFRHVSVAINENTPALLPPYATEEERIEREFVESFLREQAWWMGFGPRRNALRFFLAGGGEEPAFAGLWDEVMALQQSMLRNLEAGRYGGGRAAVMYLVAGKVE